VTGLPRTAIFAVFAFAALICGAPPSLALTRPDESEEDPAFRPSLNAVSISDDTVTGHLDDGSSTALTLQPKLQRAAQRLLAQARPRAGAIVAVDVKTGRIAAFAGTKSGNPTPSVVTSTLAPAASLFKIVTTTALLEHHVDPDREVCISGGSSFIKREHMTKPKSGAALCAPFHEALGRSRNAVFAQLATRFLRRKDLVDTAGRLGFGGDAPFDVPATVGVFDPPPQEDDLGVARAAAGFVGSRLSPVGAAQLATTIASGGRLVRLHMLQDEHDQGDVGRPRRHVVARAMHESTARELTRMMEVTIHSGTCRETFTDEDGKSYLGDVRVAGKTGTLQPTDDEPLTSWFIAFAPSRRPRIAVSVLLENGPGWRRKANEVGRDLLRAYFADRGSRGVTVPDGL
jgi:cell division protein FtsI/penicillin-binding protein 2